MNKIKEFKEKLMKKSNEYKLGAETLANENTKIVVYVSCKGYFELDKPENEFRMLEDDIVYEIKNKKLYYIIYATPHFGNDIHVVTKLKNGSQEFASNIYIVLPSE